MVSLELAVQQKRYSNSQQAVLGDLQCQIAAGQLVAIVGPSGTGKTTLLNMIAGLEAAPVGAISLNGQPLQGQPDCRLGYIFQQPRLLPWMTVLDNLRLTAPERSDTDIRAMLALVGLAGSEAEYPRMLSGGMQKRVSIARAFLAQPQLLLLDEPFVSLDQPTAQHLRHILERLWQEYRPTVLFVTHDLNEAIGIADRILFLSAAPGCLILDQPVELPRPRTETQTAVQEWKRQLLGQHPLILEGRLG